jgi:hypothetical protein
VRFRQVRRWSYGHNDCLIRYFVPVLLASNHSVLARLDAAIVLLFFAIPALSILSLVFLILSPALGIMTSAPLVAIVSLFAFTATGNFAPYFQMASGSIHDGQAVSARALPLIFFSSFISMVAALSGVFQLLRDRVLGMAPHWDKTTRFRKGDAVAAGQDDA